MRTAYLLAGPRVGASRTPRWPRWLAATLPALNWRSEIFFVNERAADDRSALLQLTRTATAFLDAHELASVHLRPLLRVASLAQAERASSELGALLEPFQRAAYHEQSEARLLLSPIVAAPSVSLAQQTAKRFAVHCAKVSFYAEGLPAEQLADEGDSGRARTYCEGPDCAKGAGIVSALWINHVFESLLERVDEPAADTLGPCDAHLVVDEGQGTVHPCLCAWAESRDALNLASAAASSPRLPGAPDPADCPRCIARCLLAMPRDLRVNGRAREGSQTLHHTGVALLRRGEPALAAALGAGAFELAQDIADRAAALLQQALCAVAQRRFDEAGALLDRALAQGADPGLVAYQRGRIEVAQHDDIEALPHFAEALRLGSPHCAAADLRFEMALCHVRIEEHAEALAHLEQCLLLGSESPPLRFYLGVCQLALAQPEAALEHLLTARRLGPAADDLTRVLIYTATCLKELERYDEAIAVLREAQALEAQELAVQNLLGFCYYKTKRHQQAVDCFERAVAIDPRSAIDWANLGSNLRDLGRIEQAMAMYERALALDPSIDFARENLARLRARLPVGEKAPADSE